MLEIHTLVELSTYLDEHRSLKDVVVQSVDISSIVEAVVAAKIENTVFLGCQIPDDALCSLVKLGAHIFPCLLYTSPSPRDRQKSRMPSSA